MSDNELYPSHWPAEMLANRRIAGRNCPVCRTKIEWAQRVRNCEICRLSYHKDCWDENGGCAAYGCANAPKTQLKASENQADSSGNRAAASAPEPGRSHS